MLLILLPTAWLAVVTFFVVICQMAARGDAIVAPGREIASDLRARGAHDSNPVLDSSSWAKPGSSAARDQR